MKEEWLLNGAVVPVDVETTSALVAEIKRLIDVVGGMALAQQEPVATVTSESGNLNVSMSWWHEPALPIGTKLYTSPLPQRTWVGLTEDEVFAVSNTMPYGDRFNFAEAIEAKLRSKNT